MKGSPILGMESLKNATYKEKNGTLIAGTKQKFFIESLEISLSMTPTSPLYTSISKTPHCFTDLIKSLFSLNKLHSVIILCRRTFKLSGEFLKALDFK